MTNLATDLARVMAVLDRIQQEADQYPHNPIGHVVEHNIGASRFREARETITAWSTRATSGGDSASLEQRARRLGQLAEPPYLIQPSGCRYTPQEVGRMLANRVVQPHYAKWLVHKAITSALANQQGVGGALPAPARTREVEKDAGPFYAACQRACAELPNGWEIRVCLEKNAGTVELCDPDGGSSYMDVDADDRLTAEVHAAIDAAMSTQPAGDVGREPVSKSVARRLAVQRGEGDVGETCNRDCDCVGPCKMGVEG